MVPLSSFKVRTDAILPRVLDVSVMAVSLDAAALAHYHRFSLYNSPYPAHDDGSAIDLYPDGESAPSPVSGTVVDVLRFSAPSRPYAATHDHLILVDTGTHVARLLHVAPTVETGQRIAVGESLGDLVRSGYFAPWVPNHVHLEFRSPDADPVRAGGSERITVDTAPIPVPWDGTGTVCAVGETWLRLDRPTHPDPGNAFAGLESDGGVLDGGFPHYPTGGLLGPGEVAQVAGTEVGTVSGRNVNWFECTVLANGTPVTGLTLVCDRRECGMKLVGEGLDFAVGDHVTVDIERTPGVDAG